jgi:hypothetical protein
MKLLKEDNLMMQGAVSIDSLPTNPNPATSSSALTSLSSLTISEPPQSVIPPEWLDKILSEFKKYVPKAYEFFMKINPSLPPRPSTIKEKKRTLLKLQLSGTK